MSGKPKHYPVEEPAEPEPRTDDEFDEEDEDDGADERGADWPK